MQLLLESKSRRPTISLTALIDVVFILLLFFMLTSQFVKWRGLDIPLAHNNAQQTQRLPIKINVADNNTLVYESQIIAVDARCAMNVLTWLNDDISTVIVQPSANTSVQQILTALDCLRAAGAPSLTLADALSPTSETERTQ
jgi:biopolymer transport protein ExbD